MILKNIVVVEPAIQSSPGYSSSNFHTIGELSNIAQTKKNELYNHIITIVKECGARSFFGGGGSKSLQFST